MFENKPYELYKGDCLEVMDKLIEQDVKVDCIITDPPYGTTACKWDSVIPFDEMWKRLKLLRKDNSAIVLFGSEPFSSLLRCSNLKEYKYDLIWDKNKGCQPALAKIQPMQSHENIHIFGIGKLLYNPQMESGTPYYRKNNGYKKENNHKLGLKPIEQINTGTRYPKSILTFPRDFSAQTRLHPTQKPVALLEYLTKTYTNENDIVLDFTMGSGSTGVACMNTNRKFIGIELDDTYFEIAEKRIAESIANKGVASMK